MQTSKIKVVVVGGGNGSAIAINALKQNAELFDISAVISMSDSGGSTGAIRKEFKMLPPADILRAVVSLSRHDYRVLRSIFYRTRISSLTEFNKRVAASRGPSLGNLFLTFATQFEGDFVRAVRALEEAVEAVGHAHPVTLDQVDLVAELDDGSIVRTEAAIDEPTYDRSKKIKQVWLEPMGKIYEEADKVIREADYIILSPGSLYTSLIAALLPKGVGDAIKASRAPLVYVAGDAYQSEGETGPESLSGIVKTLERYLPRPVDVVLYNNHKLNAEEKKFYDEKKWRIFDIDVENLPDRDVRGLDYSRNKGLCSVKLGKILKDLISNEQLTVNNSNSC